MDEIIELGPGCTERYFCGRNFPSLDPLGVAVAGRSWLGGHYRVAQHLRMHLVEITLSGDGRARVGGTDFALGAGMVLCVPAGTPFALARHGGAPWSTVWAHLAPSRWKRFPATAQVRSGIDVAPLAPLFELLEAERERADASGVALERNLAESLALWLRRLVLDAGSAGAAQRAALQALFEQVRARPGEAWSSPRLAALAGCSRSQLHRRCVEAFGRSPAAQVTRLRMQEAEYWLTGTSVPLKVIAERLGYANPYHFSTAFRRFAGVAPTVYRAGGRRA
jgi:AraC-like DNA-binding protein